MDFRCLILSLVIGSIQKIPIAIMIVGKYSNYERQPCHRGCFLFMFCSKFGFLIPKLLTVAI